MLKLKETTPAQINADQIRYAFLEAAYQELFGNGIDTDAVSELTLESRDHGQ